MANAVKTYFQLETSQYESKLRDATRHLKDMVHDVRAAGGSLNDLSAKTKQTASSFGSFEVGAKNAKDKVRELVTAFNTMSREYNVMTKSMQESDVGRSIASQLEVLKNRIKEAKKELYDSGDATKGLFDKGGELNGVLGQLGQKLGINSQLMGVITTGTLGYTAAITAATTATIAATKAWADYNSELSKQTNAAMVTTGLKGEDLNKLVDSAKAVSDIYGVDFREVVNAANTLMTQFGKTGDEAMQLIRDGMQGMIQGDGGKLLSMIQQYAPSFRDAGIEASQLVAIIQNSEGGIFTDQNMNAIVMGIRNIRLMTKQTSDALAQLGIDGQDMSRKMNDGSMSVFEALKHVSDALSNVESGSQEAGQVMQAVFGRQGTMAGTKLGEAIASLNTNLEETKTQTGAVGESLANVEMATERLNKSLRDTFGYDGWEQMANGIKGAFVGALAEAITATNDLRNAIFEVSGIDVFSVMISGAADALGPLGQILDRLRQIAGIGQLIKDGGISGATSGVGAGVGSLIGGNSGDNNTSVTETESEKALKAEIERLKKALKDANKPKTSTTKTTPKQEVKLPDGSVAALEKQLSDLQKAQKLATDTKGWKDYDAQINVVREKIAALKGELPKDKVATFKIDAITDDARKALESIQGVHIEEKKVEVAADTQQAEKAIQAIPTQKDVQVNVEEGDVNLPNIPTDETVEVTVIADTQEAYDQIKALYPDAPIELKVKVKADTTDLTKLTNTNIGSKISELQKQVNTSEWQSEDYAKAKTNLADANAFKNVFEKAVQTGIETADIDQSALWDKIVGGVDIDDAVWEDLVNRINENLAEAAINPIKLDFDTGNLTSQKSKKNNEKDDFSKLSENFSKLNGGVNQIVSGVQQIGVDVPAEIGEMLTVLQGLSTILTGILAVTTLINTKQDVQIATSIIPGFARGGIIPHAATGFVVPGNDFSDRTPVLASSGEIILNKAQQGNLASQLTSAERGTQSGTPYVDGEKIFLGINNFLKRSGRGEIVTSR